ncbi:MAG: methyltransferase domain-containing protein [Elusimicrobiota bacterium]
MIEFFRKIGAIYEKAVIKSALKFYSYVPKNIFVFLISLKKLLSPQKSFYVWLRAAIGFPVLKEQSADYYLFVKNKNYEKYLESCLNAVLYAAPGDKTKICDFGCGKGDFVKILREAGFDAVGFDNSKKAIFGKKCEYVFDVNESFGLTFDIVCLFSVLEHIDKRELESFTEEISLLTKDWLICSIPVYPDNLSDFYDDTTHRTFEDISFWDSLFQKKGFYRAYGPKEKLPFVNLVFYRKKKKNIQNIWNLFGSNIIRTRMSLGDNLCVLPALKELKEKFPEISLSVSSDSSYADVLYSSRLFKDEPRSAYGGENIVEFHYPQKLSIHLTEEFASQAAVKIKKIKSPEIFISEKDKIDFYPKGLCLAVDIRSGWKSRQWPKENFEKVCSLLKKNMGVTIVEVGKNLWTGAASKEVIRLSNSDISFTDKLTIGQTAWIIKKCGFFLGNDSGLAHLSAAVKVKSFVIYGPAEASLRSHEDYSIPFYDEECYGCYTKGIYPENKLREGCPRKHHKCMKNIRPESVYEKICRFMRFNNGI